MHDEAKSGRWRAPTASARGNTAQAFGAARQQVEAMGDPRTDESAASERLANGRRERKERLELAWRTGQNPPNQERPKNKNRHGSADRSDLADYERRQRRLCPIIMCNSPPTPKQIIVGAGVSQNSSDSGELMPAVERVEENLARTPGATGQRRGLTNRQNIIETAAKG